MRRLAGGLIFVGLSASLTAQVIDRPPPQQPSQGRGGGGGGFGGVGLSFSLGKKKPKVKTLEQRDADIPDALTDQIIIVTAGTAADAARITRAGGVTLIEATPLEAISRTMIVAALEPGDSVAAATARLEGVRGVEWAQPNQLFQPLGKASLPKRFTLHGVTPATARVSGTIAMIDTPVDTRHESLKGAVVQQTVYSPDSAPAIHGTAVASLLVGTGEVKGIAAGARLISLAAFAPSKDGTGLSQTRYLAKAVNGAWSLNPHVLNLSFGGNPDRLLASLLDAVRTRGICVAAAAGNGGAKGKVLFPATHPASLAITAVDEKLKPYTWASRGTGIDVAGVGVGLLATVPGGYRQVSGTSFATAIIAGALLRLPACSTARNPGAMKQQVTALAQDLGAKGRDPIFGAGLFRLAIPASKKK